MTVSTQSNLPKEEREGRGLRVSTIAWLSGILAVYFLLAALFAVSTPPWQAPDEPAHFNYIAYVAEKGEFPVLHFGDYPHDYLEQIKSAKFPPDMPIHPIRYEFHQPPLYYVLAAPVYSLSGGSLLAVRLLSVLLGAGIVLLAYGVARAALPGEPAVALGTAAIVAFLPQHLATVSQVGNDVLAELLVAAVLFALARGAVSMPRSPRDLRFPLLIGVLLGLVLVGKTTAYIVIPVAAFAFVWRWVRQKASLARILVEAAAVALPAALLALPWYARDIYVYGWPDFLGLNRHEQIVVGQTRTSEFIAANGWAAYWRRTFEWTFKSFVGVFGWMSAWLETRGYYLLGVWMAIPVIGWLAWRVRSAAAKNDVERSPAAIRPDGIAAGDGASLLPRARMTRALLAATVALTLAAYVYYNITFLQHQGRYLFTAVIPIAIFLATGWRRAFEPAPARIAAGALALWAAGLALWGIASRAGLPNWPLVMTLAPAAGLLGVSFLSPRWRSWAYIAPFVAPPLVAVYALFGVIVPALRLP